MPILDDLTVRDTLDELVSRRASLELRQTLADYNPVDIAAYLEEITTAQAAYVYRLLPKETGADVFSYLESDTQENLIKAYSDREVQDLVAGLMNDDLVDMMEELPASVAKRVLDNTPPARRKLVNQLLQYPEDSAGSIMSTECIHLKRDMTILDAIARLRTLRLPPEMYYTCFVTTPDRILEGWISIGAILNAHDEDRVGDLMDTDIISVHTTTDQETAARLFDRYDLPVLPVVDQESRLVGVITVDDAFDVMTEETSEDISRMTAVIPSRQTYLETSVWNHSKRRFGWLLVLMLSGIINGIILHRYEAAFVLLPILVTFIPMITDTGGNAGSQSSGLMIRGMALGEISFHNLWSVILKEVGVAFLVGGLLAAVNFARLLITHGGDVKVALTVSLAILFTVVAAKVAGGALPLLARAIKLDPAIMAAPVITTVVDALALFIYFEVASLLIPGLR